MTDLLPAAATTNGGESQIGGAVRSRVVLDTSVLIADPSCVVQKGMFGLGRCVAHWRSLYAMQTSSTPNDPGRHILSTRS